MKKLDASDQYMKQLSSWWRDRRNEPPAGMSAAEQRAVERAVDNLLAAMRRAGKSTARERALARGWRVIEGGKR